MDFENIKKWTKTHDRNIKIALEVAAGKSRAQVAREVGMSRERIRVIYTVVTSKLCSQKFHISFSDALKDKNFYDHPDAFQMISSYAKKFGII